MQWTHEHDELRRTARRIVDEEINPHVDEWEEAGQFPAHHVMKLLGDAGLIGISRPTDYGGLDLDYSYEVACAEEMGGIHAWCLDRDRCPNQYVYSGVGEVWKRRAPGGMASAHIRG